MQKSHDLIGWVGEIQQMTTIDAFRSVIAGGREKIRVHIHNLLYIDQHIRETMDGVSGLWSDTDKFRYYCEHHTKEFHELLPEMDKNMIRYLECASVQDGPQFNMDEYKCACLCASIQMMAPKVAAIILDRTIMEQPEIRRRIETEVTMSFPDRED